MAIKLWEPYYSTIYSKINQNFSSLIHNQDHPPPQKSAELVRHIRYDANQIFRVIKLIYTKKK